MNHKALCNALLPIVLTGTLMSHGPVSSAQADTAKGGIADTTLELGDNDHRCKSQSDDEFDRAPYQSRRKCANSRDQLFEQGKAIFRFDTFGDETFWTDTLRIHEVIQAAVSPQTALAVGLKVDADAVPPGVLETADLTDPATTVALLKLGAVVGLKGTVQTINGKDTLSSVGSPARSVTRR